MTKLMKRFIACLVMLMMFSGIFWSDYMTSLAYSDDYSDDADYEEDEYNDDFNDNDYNDDDEDNYDGVDDYDDYDDYSDDDDDYDDYDDDEDYDDYDDYDDDEDYDDYEEDEEEVISVISVSLNKKSATLYKGEELTLEATIDPYDADDQDVTWKSSNTKVARVDEDGVVTAVGKGEAKITVITDDGDKTAVCKITVKAPIPVTKVKINKEAVSIVKGNTYSLKAKITPTNATNKNVKWKSSNKKVVTIDNNGVIKGNKKGTATITVTTVDGKKTAKCKVTVTEPIKVKSIKFDKKSYSVKKGKTITLKPSILPKDATNKEVTYKSSNKKIATIDKNGKVTAKKKGTVKITVTTKDGKKKGECKVVVK